MRTLLTRCLALGLMAVVVGCQGATGGPGASALPVAASTAPAVTPAASASLAPTAPATSPPASASLAPTSPTPDPSFLIYDPSADARADVEAALAKAQKDGRPVLLDFGADWCPDCWILSAYLESKEGKARITNRAHVVRIDVGGFDRNLDLVKEYGDLIWTGIPAVVVLRPDGTIVGSSADGALAHAAQMSKSAVLDYLGRWVP